MAHQSSLIADDIHAYLHEQQHKDLLRFITCGSVDDGKSTLIGRLLWDSRLIFEDQLAALAADSKKVGTQGDEIDYALLLDGLQAEREQGITIDVAYRFFSTAKRKFIVADTPGHEQYTRNMVTGASTADIAVILIDARKGVLTQTRRHSYLVSLVGIRKVVVAVNKMDLVDYDQDRFEAICAEYRALATALDFDEIVCIPLSALKGENVVSPGVIPEGLQERHSRMDHHRHSRMPVSGIQGQRHGSPTGSLGDDEMSVIPEGLYRESSSCRQRHGSPIGSLGDDEMSVIPEGLYRESSSCSQRHGSPIESLGDDVVGETGLSFEGDVVYAGTTWRRNMPWYSGPSLLEYLETVQVTETTAEQPFRMGIQWVNRPHSEFRGFSGTVVSGALKPGDTVSVVASGRQSRVTRIVTLDGDLTAAKAGQAITVCLEDEIDISRGDMLADSLQRPASADQFQAKLVWLHEEALLPGRSYLLKAGSVTASAQITELKRKVNVNTLQFEPGKTLAMNEVAVCNLSTNQAIAFDAFSECRQTGNFILIDRFSNATVGAGMIDFPLRRATNIHWQNLSINKQSRAEMKGQKPKVLWFTGLSGAGKSTIANLVEKKLHALGKHTYLLDGDNVRHGLNRDLGFTAADRVENIRRIAETARLFVDAGLIVLTAFISPFKSERALARELLEDGEFCEIFIDTPLSLCEQRDPKGLYQKARRGALKNFTGIDSGYEQPVDPEVRIDGVNEAAEAAADRIVRTLFG